MLKAIEKLQDKLAKNPKIALDRKKSEKWLIDSIKKLSLHPNAIFRDTENNANKFAIGQMFFFHYDPKTKATLPYYDTFPLVIPIETYKDGFLGLNLHYLPPKLRAILLDKLIDLASDRRYDLKTKMKLSYNLLGATTRYKEFKPCIKRYLTSHMRSRFAKVHPMEWDLVIYLQLARFVKATQNKVWSDSRKIIG